MGPIHGYLVVSGVPRTGGWTKGVGRGGEGVRKGGVVRGGGGNTGTVGQKVGIPVTRRVEEGWRRATKGRTRVNRSER
jgi:hypothetical protein